MRESESAEVFSKNLRRLLKLSGMSSKEAAIRVGVSATAFSEWMNGKKYPRIKMVEKLADILHVQKSDLIEDPDIADCRPQTVEARLISAGIDKMPVENREKALNMMKVIFAEYAEYFKESDDDDN